MEAGYSLLTAVILAEHTGQPVRIADSEKGLFPPSVVGPLIACFIGNGTEGSLFIQDIGTTGPDSLLPCPLSTIIEFPPRA